MLKNVFIKLLSFIIILATLLSLAVSCVSPKSDKASDPEENENTDQDQSGDRPTVETSPAIKITELMVVNTVGAEDSEGKTSPWIEILNISDGEVDLSEYSIKTGESAPVPLPDITVASGEYALVFANGKKGEDSIELTLSSKSVITVTHGDLISFSFLYTNKTANHSFVTENGSETAFPTPGYENIKEKDSLVISELMASNSLYPIDGIDCDWIELYNDSDSPIDLSKQYISTDSTEPYRAPLPDVVLGAGEYILLACERDLPFKLSKDGESVYITRNDGVLSASLTYEAMEKNTSWTCDKGVVDYPTPGMANTVENHASIICQRKGLVISEVISSNTKYSPFNKKYCDVVEIFNNSQEDILLSEYFLSDKGSEPQKYRLPEVTLKAGEYYLVHCDEEVSGAAPINISSSGENIWLTREDGYISDALCLPDIPLNRSWGRSDGKLVYFTTPSLGKANSGGYERITQTPLASMPSGVYTEAVTVTLSGEGKIYYTTDGSEPSTASKQYSGEAITLKSSGAIRAIAYDGDRIPSYGVTYNYFINIPDYTIPVVKISMANGDLFGESGIYTKYNSEIERKANCAFYIDGNEEFSIDCGIKIFGAYSRRYPKKSFQLEFRAKYGKSRLEYKLFDNLNIESFGNIVLRSGSQNTYCTDTMMVDEFVTSLAAYSGNMPEVLVQAYRPCHLYLNGEYWGLYFIREKIDDDCIADHYGVSKSSVTIIDWPNSVKEGSSSQGWSTIWKNIYTKKLDFSKEENYRWLADQLDLDSFTDMIIMRMYSGDLDLGNIRAFKSPEYDDGKWHFILYDNDISFRGDLALSTRFRIFLKDSRYTKIHALFRALMKNKEYQKYFLERLAFHLNSTISVANAHARIAEMVAELENDMKYSIDRWKNENVSGMVYMESMNRWRKNINELYRCTGDIRIKWFVRDAANSLGLSAKEIEEYMGEEFVGYLPQ